MAIPTVRNWRIEMNDKLIEFTFATAWQHRGKSYKEGESAKLSARDVEKLTALKAGRAGASKPVTK